MTALLGAGMCPAGTCPAGFGAPVTSAALTAPNTYGAVSSVAIDPVSRDFVLDEHGTEVGMDDVAQRVWICLATLRGSRRSFSRFGLKAPLRIGDNVKTETHEAVRQALAPVLSDGSVELVSVDVETDPRKPTTLYALVTWRDIKRGTKPLTFKAAL